MKLFKNIYVALLVFLFSILIFLFALYQYCLSSVSDDEVIKSVVIEPGSTVDRIASILVDDGLVRSKLVFKVYVKLNGKNNLKAGTFSLSESMSLKEIVAVLEKGNNSCTGEYKITFKEGLNMRGIASVIEENTDNSIDDVYAVLNNKEYLKGLIDKYWFLSDLILNDNIYYSLEGYLYPNTYYFCDKDVEVEKIFESMLDEMASQLEEYRDEILLEYNQNMDFAKSKLIVVERHRQIEELKRQEEEKKKVVEQEELIEQAVNEVVEEVIVAPVEIVEDEDIITVSFTVTGTKEKIKELKNKIIELELDYE